MNEAPNGGERHQASYPDVTGGPGGADWPEPHPWAALPPTDHGAAADPTGTAGRADGSPQSPVPPPRGAPPPVSPADPTVIPGAHPAVAPPPYGAGPPGSFAGSVDPGPTPGFDAYGLPVSAPGGAHPTPRLGAPAGPGPQSRFADPAGPPGAAGFAAPDGPPGAAGFAHPAGPSSAVGFAHPAGPSSAAGFADPAGPAEDPGLADPLAVGTRPSWQPRITPSPPPKRGRLLLAAAIGLLGGLLIFGTGGFFLGRSSGGTGAVTPAPVESAVVAQPSGGPSLPPYERAQLAVNQRHFSGQLARFAESWLPYVTGCQRSGTPGGPRLVSGEVARVVCRYGNVSLYFVQFTSVAERDKTRARALGQNVDARQLTPGVAPGAEKATPSGRTTGSYVEYAYQFGVGAQARPVAGIWWDDQSGPVGAHLVAYWKDVAGQSWEPVRDLWGRYA